MAPSSCTGADDRDRAGPRGHARPWRPHVPHQRRDRPGAVDAGHAARDRRREPVPRARLPRGRARGRIAGRAHGGARRERGRARGAARDRQGPGAEDPGHRPKRLHRAVRRDGEEDPARSRGLHRAAGAGAQAGEDAVRDPRHPRPRRARAGGAGGPAARPARLRREGRAERHQSARGGEPPCRARAAGRSLGGGARAGRARGARAGA